MQIVDSLKSLVSGLGTSKDKTASLAYVLNLKTPAELNAMHRGDWLARKVVDIIPNDMTREWRAWQAEGDQIEKIEALEQAPLICLQVKVNRALQMARLLGGSVIYIGIRNAKPDEALDPEKVGQGDLQYLHVLSRHEVSGGEQVLDVTSEFYGQPAYYEVAGKDGFPVRIHPSRMVRFEGAPVLDRRSTGGDTWGDSVLQVLYDALQNAGASQSHIAALIPEAKTDVIYIPGLAEYASTAAGRTKLTARFGYANDVKSMFNALLLDGTGTTGPGSGGEKWEQKQISFAQLPELMRQFLQIASGAADIPVTRLLGESPGGLNATGDADLRNYYDNIAARQRIELEPALNRLDEVIIRSALGSRPPKIYYEWSPLWGLSEKEKADVFKIKADAARALAGAKAGPLMAVNALSDALVNTFVEDGSLPGLEDAIAEHGRLADQEDEEDEDGDPDGEGGGPDADLPFADAYDPDQPRDKKGRWTRGGRGGGLIGLFFSLASFLRFLRGNPGKHAIHRVGPVRNHAAISSAGGPDTRGWSRIMATSEVNHALNEHGRGSAKWKGGSRLAQADLGKVDAIVSSARPRLQQRKGGDRLVYTATLGSRRYTYSETVSRRQQALIFHTMWWKE